MINLLGYMAKVNIGNIVNKNKCVFLCLLSSKSAIGDSFVDLINNLDEELRKEVLVIKTAAYTDELFDVSSSSIVNLVINRSNIGFFSIYNFISTLRDVSCNYSVGRVFVYGVSPLNHVASLLIRSKEKAFWVHDADIHPGAHISERVSNILLRCYGFVGVASRFLVSNNYLKRRVTKRFGVSSEFVSVINFPYISQIVYSEKCSSPPENDIDILFFGRVEPYKGIDLLLSALSKLSKKNIIYKTVIAGKGYEVNIPRDLDVVRIDSYVSNSKLRLLISKAKVCVFPYTSATGTQAIQTALAIGTRCLVSNLPPLVEIAEQVQFKGVVVFEDVDELVSCIQRILDVNEWDRSDISETALQVFSEKKFGFEVTKLCN